MASPVRIQLAGAIYHQSLQQFGHPFSGRYKALVVDGSGNGYLRMACEYVRSNS